MVESLWWTTIGGGGALLGISRNNFHLQPMLGDKKSLAEIGVGDGDMVMLDRQL